MQHWQSASAKAAKLKMLFFMHMQQQASVYPDWGAQTSIPTEEEVEAFLQERIGGTL